MSLEILIKKQEKLSLFWLQLK